MTHLTPARIAERKAQLATRAALERIRLTLALHSVRATLKPPPAGETRFRRPIVAVLVGFAAKRLGPSRLRRWLRIASLATIAYRIASAFRT